MNIKIIQPSFKILTPIEQIEEMEKRIEYCGRICYKSEDSITEDSHKNFVKNRLEDGHLSIFEHCNISVLFTLSRAASHQLVRHRIASFSQESQRYNKYENATIRIIIPPTFDEQSQQEFIKQITENTSLYCVMRNKGFRPEDCRYILPNCVASDVVMTANIREWLHIFNVRTQKGAQWEIKNLMLSLKSQLGCYIPEIFGGECE